MYLEGTYFSDIYNCFLGKITDDMYVELTPEDTLRDLRSLLINAIPNFEFPRKDLFKYIIGTEDIAENDLSSEDFVIGINEEYDDYTIMRVEKSYFVESLTQEEINILAILMMVSWVQRQVTSIETTRMKYSGLKLGPSYQK